MDDGNPTRFQTAEIEFGDGNAPTGQKSAPLQKLYETQASSSALQAQARGKSFSYAPKGEIFVSCKVEDWNKNFALFGDFLRDAKKYYKKTCINASYEYYFSYRPMYRELSHEQLCWYLFWRSRIREGSYPKTGLSYIFLYLYEQINLSDVIGPEKAYANIVRLWKAYRAEFPRLDKYIADWLIDLSLINRLEIDLGDISQCLPDIIGVATIPEFYISENFFKDKGNLGFIMRNFSAYDYKTSKFCSEKTQETFELHIASALFAVLSSPEFYALSKKETQEGANIKATRESYMGALCAYEHKKKITVEYKNLYRNFFLKQCVTYTIRCAENLVRDYLGIKSKLPVNGYPEQLKKVLDEYKKANFVREKATGKTKAAKNAKAEENEDIPAAAEFSQDVLAAAEIEKESWDTTMTLVELQNRDMDQSIDNDFVAIDTGNAETYEGPDIFDVLENLENLANPAPQGGSDMASFVLALSAGERAALGLILGAKDAGKSFDMLCGEFLSQSGAMLESVADEINGRAIDHFGDVLIDMASGEIIEDYKSEIAQCINGAKQHDEHD